MGEILTVAHTVQLQTICEAAQRCAKVARLLESGDVAYGTARSISDSRGAFLPDTTDVRDGYLRVTTAAGFEVFWPVRELMPQVSSGEFVLDYEA